MFDEHNPTVQDEVVS
jgi:hypothetical protein